MSSIISAIVANTGKPPEALAITDIPSGLVERDSNQNAVFKSNPLGPMVTDARYSDLGRVAVDDVASKETAALISEIDPNDSRLYTHLRYFAQTGNRRGFTYTYTDGRGQPAEVTFDTGILVTRERALADSLHNDIERQGGIGGYVQEITATVYEEMRSSADRYAQLRAVSGSFGSDKIDPHAQMRDAEKRQMTEELNALRKQVRDLEAVVGQLSPEARAEMMSKSSERAVLQPQPATSSGTETQPRAANTGIFPRTT